MEEIPVVETVRSCPYRGAKNDPELRFGFPAPNTYCYKASPPDPIALDYQSRCCLTTEYVNCPVFQLKQAQPLPEAIAASGENGVVERGTLLRWIVPILLVLGLGGAFVWSQLDRTVSAEPTAPPIAIVASDTPTTSPTPTSTATSTPTSTLTPTQTPTNTSTPTVTPTDEPTATRIPSPTPTETVVPTPAPFTTDVTISAGRVNVRRGPSTGYSIITTTDNLTQPLTAIGRSADSRWIVLCCVERESDGWISADFVRGEELNQLPVYPAPSTIGIVSETLLNVLDAPRYSAETIAVVNRGDVYPVVGSSVGSEWIELCCFSGDVGWVFSGTIVIDGDLSLPAEP